MVLNQIESILTRIEHIRWEGKSYPHFSTPIRVEIVKIDSNGVSLFGSFFELRMDSIGFKFDYKEFRL